MTTSSFVTVATPVTILSDEAQRRPHPHTYADATTNQQYSTTTGILQAATTTTATHILPLKSSSALIPQQGDVIIGLVTRVTLRDVRVEILGIETQPSSIQPLLPPLHGILRQRDIRLHDVDNVVLYNMYRVNDIIRASILSLTDPQNYYLTTASNEYGVMLAYSSAGQVMMPISWEAMRCPLTGEAQQRKVAKIDMPKNG